MEFSIRDEHLEEFAAAAAVSLRLSREEPGNLMMEVYMDADAHNKMFVHSVWRDQAAITFHNAQPYTQALRELAAAALLAPPTIVRLERLATER